MFKRILGYVVCGIVCANFGILSAVFPLFYMPLVALVDQGSFDSSYASLIISALLCGVIAGLLFYIYQRNKRLNHEEMPVFLPSAVIGYLCGIVLIVIVLFLMSASQVVAYS